MNNKNSLVIEKKFFLEKFRKFLEYVIKSEKKKNKNRNYVPKSMNTKCEKYENKDTLNYRFVAL